MPLDSVECYAGMSALWFANRRAPIATMQNATPSKRWHFEKHHLANLHQTTSVVSCATVCYFYDDKHRLWEMAVQIPNQNWMQEGCLGGQTPTSSQKQCQSPSSHYSSWHKFSSMASMDQMRPGPIAARPLVGFAPMFGFGLDAGHRGT